MNSMSESVRVMIESMHTGRMSSRLSGVESGKKRAALDKISMLAHYKRHNYESCA